MRRSLLSVAVFVLSSIGAAANAAPYTSKAEACIRKNCSNVYADCVGRQNLKEQSLSWVKKHCSSQKRGCENSCQRDTFHDPVVKKKSPPGGPPLYPPSHLR